MVRAVRRAVVAACAAASLALPLAAQDSTRAPEGVTVRLTYTPGSRPGLIVLPGPGLDSVRAILRRDLDYSDRFEVVLVPDAPATGAAAPAATERGATPGVNYALWRRFGAAFALEVLGSGTGGSVQLRLHDLQQGQLVNAITATVPTAPTPQFRMQVHALADEVVRWVTGAPGIAATRLAYASEGRIWLVDSDGYNAAPVTAPGVQALSPAWSPDGRRLAWTQFSGGRGSVIVYTLGGETLTVPGADRNLNITPAFSPDGRFVAYAHADENGTNIQVANVAERCCVQRLTVGRFADNLSPTFAPDGRRLAFVSTRAGPPQIYSMAADGTDVTLLVPFDFGATGAAYAPDWSADGAAVTFHRDVRGFQVFVYEVASRRLRQLTSSGRNEDPAFAPDGRHVVFVSDRSGERQLWIVDVETNRLRQLRTPGAARLPAWSRRLGAVSSSR